MLLLFETFSTTRNNKIPIWLAASRNATLIFNLLGFYRNMNKEIWRLHYIQYHLLCVSLCAITRNTPVNRPILLKTALHLALMWIHSEMNWACGGNDLHWKLDPGSKAQADGALFTGLPFDSEAKFRSWEWHHTRINHIPFDKLENEDGPLQENRFCARSFVL